MDTIRERPAGADPPLLTHPGWAEEFPWLVQGLSRRGSEAEPFDLAFFGPEGGGEAVWQRWRRLMESLETPAAVHGRQVHGRRVAFHRELPPGLLLLPGADGHVTAAPGLLLTISVADCVPVFLVAPGVPAVGLLHAGWRGVADGILREGIARCHDQLGVAPDDLRLHLGPGICGRCYEVGPEVHRALGLPDPGEPRPVDLQEVLCERATSLGVAPERCSRSEICTKCGEADLFSHRGGDLGRQVAFLGLRGGAVAGSRA